MSGTIAASRALAVRAPGAYTRSMFSLRFDNRFLMALPGEAPAGDAGDPRPRQVAGAAWSPMAPTPVAAPRLVAFSKEMLARLGIPEAEALAPEFAEVFAGNRLLPGMQPYAACYGGHQFGHWAGQLGDGRAISLGEALGPSGERLELQLKGAGPTPYSRRADGRAVLRSSIREFLASEAMHHLGVPTTRALCLVATGEEVVRDMFYDGHPAPEPGAIVTRVAPSFLRFGTLELPAARGDAALLARLVDFVIARDFPAIEGDERARRIAFFREVCARTATLMAHWMRVGFVHGVMNTDNMSLSGLTIDYGPFGWLEPFDQFWTPNTTDLPGRRYAYGRQPDVAAWNLARLAEALLPLFGDPEPLEAALEAYGATYVPAFSRTLAAKFGFAAFEDGDGELAAEAFAIMQRGEIDMTHFFRDLARAELEAPDAASLEGAFYEPSRYQAERGALTAWLARYAARVAQDGRAPAARRAEMDAVNPRYVLRNYLAQEAISAAEAGDYRPVAELLDVLRRPYEERPGREAYAAKRPEWARNRPGCSTLSCSS